VRLQQPGEQHRHEAGLQAGGLDPASERIASQA
jgi:hypothetical protein